jgi:hypothetical protein
VIRPIETSETSEATPQRHALKAAGPATAAGKSFASVLAGQKKVADDQGHHAHAPKRTAKGGPIEAPKGEMWRPVRGDDNYARIMNGPRRGLYINLSRGARRGQVFHVEHRDGKRVHVYGKGENAKVVLASKDSGKVHGHGHQRHHVHAARAETWAPVEGASNYADILSGPRNGYYVNTSGGERDGMVFHIVRRHGKTFHIYGRGKHRQVVEVHHSKKPHHTEHTGSRKPETGGVGGTDAAAGGTGGAAPDRKPTPTKPASAEHKPTPTKPVRD